MTPNEQHPKPARYASLHAAIFIGSVSLSILAGIALVALLMGKHTKEKQRQEIIAEQQQQITQQKREAWLHAEPVARNMVLLPKRARFGDQAAELDKHVEPMGNDEWFVSGWVDAEEYNGERIVKDWMVGLRHTKDGKWEVIDSCFREDVIKDVLKEMKE